VVHRFLVLAVPRGLTIQLKRAISGSLQTGYLLLRQNGWSKVGEKTEEPCQIEDSFALSKSVTWLGANPESAFAANSKPLLFHLTELLDRFEVFFHRWNGIVDELLQVFVFRLLTRLFKCGDVFLMRRDHGINISTVESST
jgi:hypothetical protein